MSPWRRRPFTITGWQSHNSHGAHHYRYGGLHEPIKSKKHGSQKGTFVGNPAAVHIHIVSDNTHIQVGNKRHNVDPDDDVSAAAALAWLTTSGGAGRPGYADCFAWLGQPNRQRV